MIKTLVIFVLLIVVAVGAFLTRPSQESFKTYWQQQQPGEQPSLLTIKGLESTVGSSIYLNSIIYHDRLLWVTIERNGVTQYVGAFGHWFKSSAASVSAK